MSVDLQPALRLFQETLMSLLLCFTAVFIKTSLACREILTRLKRGKEQKWDINPAMAQCKEIPDSLYISCCGRNWNSLTLAESDAEITATAMREEKLEENDLLQCDLILIWIAECLWEPFLPMDVKVQEEERQLYTAGGALCHAIRALTTYSGTCKPQEQQDSSYLHYLGCLAEPGKLNNSVVAVMLLIFFFFFIFSS